MKRLKITRCKISASKIEPTGDTFEVSINPESYSHSYSVQYTGTMGKGETATGASAPVPKYAMAGPEKVSFSLVIDGTGVVTNSKGTVAKQIDKLRTIVYDYDGDAHEPNAVKLSWGDGLKEFFGRLTDMSVDYTLFHPDGEPLRAKLKLNFIEARTAAQEALEANRRSPDLTHIVRVKAGDTLPVLCHQIYKDASKYLAIAAENDLDSFHKLEPDTLLRFPPMR